MFGSLLVTQLEQVDHDYLLLSLEIDEQVGYQSSYNIETPSCLLVLERTLRTYTKAKPRI